MINELVQAVRNGDVAAMTAILDRDPELVNATIDEVERVVPTNTGAMRLLHVAIAENQPAAARLLIERGADLNTRNADGRAPLHDAFELDRAEISSMLFEAGAEIDVAVAAAYGPRPPAGVARRRSLARE